MLTVQFPEKATTYGMWLSDNPNQEDVHILVENSQAVVIGHDMDIPNMKFTPSALCFNKDGTVTYQYKGEDGEAKVANLEEKHVKSMLLGLLAQVDAFVKSVSI